MRYFILPLILLSTFPQFVFAQQQDSLRHYTLDDSVLVVAGRYSTSLARETNTVTVIDGRAITDMADHSVLEALQWDVPSAFLAETISAPSRTSTERSSSEKPATAIEMR